MMSPQHDPSPPHVIDAATMMTGPDVVTPGIFARYFESGDVGSERSSVAVKPVRPPVEMIDVAGAVILAPVVMLIVLVAHPVLLVVWLLGA